MNKPHRNKTLVAIANARQQIKLGRDPVVEIDLLLMSQLPLHLHKILAFVNTRGVVYATEIADLWGKSANFTSSALKELWELGLLNRQLEESPDGKRFKYTRKGSE